jgi:hypothetical protein
LDEAEALMAQLGGIMDCLDGTTTTENASMMSGVERISIIEINQNRVS